MSEEVPLLGENRERGHASNYYDIIEEDDNDLDEGYNLYTSINTSSKDISALKKGAEYEGKNKTSKIVNAKSNNDDNIIVFNEDKDVSSNNNNNDNDKEEEEEDEDDDVIMALTGIACVFVVCFDAKGGNIIEWSKIAPNVLPLDGIEFKAMPSGLHKVETDYVQKNLYGIACFHNMKTNDHVKERGARMRSVGILCRDYRSLAEHYSFLSQQAEKVNQNPGSYKSLEEYLENNKDPGGYIVPPKLTTLSSNSMGNLLSTSSNSMLTSSSSISLFKPLEDIFISNITVNVASLISLVNFFNDNIMLLWKALLLRKRLLFYSDVPVGVLCSRVHSVGHLLSGGSQVRRILFGPHKLYYVSVNDIPLLQKAKYYIACTADKIFQEKADSNMFDIYVNYNKIKIVNQSDEKLLLSLNSSRRLFESLKEDISLQKDRISKEMCVKTFFTSINQKVIQFIKKFSISGIITLKDLEDSTIFDVSDAPFVQTLCDVLKAKIKVEQQPFCCWCCW